MEFIYSNFLDTTTMLTVSSNTSVAEYLMNPDPYFQYYTDGYNDDSLTASITVTFDTATSISRIALINHNLKEFRVFYNGATANTFTISGGDTTASYYITNSETSQYFRVNTVSCNSITIDMKKTITAAQEKALGLLVYSDLLLDFPQLPSAKNFKPRRNPKQIVHTLSDGGTRLHNVRTKWSASVDLEYITTTFRDDLYSVWSSGDPFMFCPFGTTTGWDIQIYDCVWPGPFEFYEYSDDATVAGFSGTIKLMESPT